MATVLVVDDAKLDRQLVGGILRKQGDLEVSFAAGGHEALASLAESLPTLIVADLQMPEMNGLELVDAVRERYPPVPVIIMTAYGSEEIAAEALRRGAVSYVPKRNLVPDLATTVQSVCALVAPELERRRALECLDRAEYHYVIDSDVTRIPAIVGLVRQAVARMSLCDKTQLTRVAVALDEALCNAIEHGNLEIDGSEREQGIDAYLTLIQQRGSMEPYRGRRAFLTAHLSRDEGIFVVRDEGKGFDPTNLPDPRDPENLLKLSGRGLLLIRSFMDEVRHNESGTELTMVLRRGSKSEAA
ncbi:MAG: ATP-binding protein [Planctomycetota bacterium]|jgi:CheY-like chemotaxis protein